MRPAGSDSDRPARSPTGRFVRCVVSYLYYSHANPMMQGDRFTMYSGGMPITRKATEAATRHRIHGKHIRWATEMRAAGWMVISPETMKAPDGVWLDAIAAELRERGWLVAAPKDLVREVVG